MAQRIGIDSLIDTPTLFSKRLRYFLSDDDADRVIQELAGICNQCWDAEIGDCDCHKPRRRGQRKGFKMSAETKRKISESVSAAWERGVKIAMPLKKRE
jgi:hypothetical protein